MAEVAEAVIEVRVEEIGQLFDNLDPFPFRERDLDKGAEDFIVGWARELPADRPFRIVVHLPEDAAENRLAQDCGAAFARFFAYRADGIGRDLRELFRVGRQSLIIGLGALAAFLIAGQIAADRLGDGYLARFVGEGLIILAWVANWKPIGIFLYDWWPLARQRNLYRRLAAAYVEIRPQMRTPP